MHGISHRLQATAAVALALTLGACQPFVVPAPGRLQAWTLQLRDSQPHDAFAAVTNSCSTSSRDTGTRIRAS
jgi:hypothetical protein